MLRIGLGRRGKVQRFMEGAWRRIYCFTLVDLYCDYLMLSERSLGGCIGFGGSAQAGEKSKHCCCAGAGKSIDRQLIEHFFIYH